MKRAEEANSVCLAIYVGTERPQPTVSSSEDYLAIREVLPKAVLFRRRAQQWHEALSHRLRTPHVYQVNGGCACLFLSDDEDADDSERLSAIAALRRYVETALESGPVSLLICWLGDERKSPEFQHVSAVGIEHIDFGRAWDRPLLVSVD